MGDGPLPAGRGVVPGQVAEIIVILDGEPGRRGSGYRVGPTSVLTAAHVIEGAVSVRVRFDVDLPGEWITEASPGWVDPRSDLAVLTIAPREGEPPVAVARFGRIGGDRAAVLTAWAVGFPRFKLRSDDDVGLRQYRDSHQADGSIAVLSNRREGTLEITVPPPERDPDPGVSPWEGMSGAAVWVEDRIVGVIAKHHRSDGLGRLAAARLDLALAGFDPARRVELRTLLDLPEVLPDVVRPSADAWVRTAYQAQVRDIAPDNLLDRDAELDELVQSCAGDRPYAWWQAGPWAGKSALMSWFVLHPPAGVDVVSFFVTARLAGQSDSDACTTALIEQLAALIGESSARPLTAGARHGTLRQLLEDAANRSREAGRRLLLVIDGLDEDSGAATGPSIAALLPRRPPPEVRILVASRPHPPIPDDVADDHPLRTITPRQLDVSDHARDIERRAKHELRQLLTGEQLHRDVLGLITAAGGGLALGDLEQLTERPPFEIEHLLGGVFGRSVGSRIGAISTGYLDERVYLFSHETLRLVAEQQYGASLAAYRDQLHTWAGTWRQRGWPRDTPQYLLRSYPRMLASSRDLPRLVACATDQVRHDRMRDLTGGDALAFTEISTAQQLILTQPDPDLTGLALLAVQRDHLTDRNSNIPTNLPAVWAMLDQLTRAEALAYSVPENRRAVALTRLAEAVAAGGDHDRAEALTAQITHPYQRAKALARLAEAVAAGDDHDRATRLANQAEALTAQITDPYTRAWALTRLAEAVAAGDDHDRATRLANHAEALTAQITPADWQAKVLTRLAEVVATGGDHDRAEAFTAQITDRNRRAKALARLAGVVAAGGDHDRATRLANQAETLTGQDTTPYGRAWALARLAEVVATGGDHNRATRLANQAEALTRQLPSYADWQAEVLTRLAGVVAAGGDHDRATRLANQAETLTAQITPADQRAEALTRLAGVVAAGGDHDRAARLANQAEAQELTGQSTSSYQKAEVLTRLAKAVATGGDHDRAEAFTAQITDRNRRAEALARLAGVVAAGGDHDRAARLANQAEAQELTGQSTSSYQKAEVLTRLAEAVAAGGDHDRATRLANQAETLTGQDTTPYGRAWALARLAEAVAASGDHDRATRLANQAETLTAQITDRNRQAWALARLAKAVATGGDHDRAEALIAQIINPHRRAEALAPLAEAVAAGGDHDRAARLANQAEAQELTGQIIAPHRRAEALARLAGVVASGGDHNRAARLADRAEAFTAEITDQNRQAWALARLAKAVATGGDHDRAETVTARITDPDSRVWALAQLGWILMRASKETSLVPEHGSGSPLMVRARHLLAAALVTGSWTLVVASLGRVDPLAVTALADEVQVRWGLDSPNGPQDGRER